MDRINEMPHNMQLLTPKETAKFLRVSIYWLQRQRLNPSAQSIPYIRIGSRVFYDRDDLLAWLKKQRVTHAASHL